MPSGRQESPNPPGCHDRRVAVLSGRITAKPQIGHRTGLNQSSLLRMPTTYPPSTEARFINPAALLGTSGLNRRDNYDDDSLSPSIGVSHMDLRAANGTRATDLRISWKGLWQKFAHAARIQSNRIVGLTSSFLIASWKSQIRVSGLSHRNSLSSTLSTDWRPQSVDRP